MMYTAFICLILANLLYFALHISSQSSFPKPLDKEEEADLFMKYKEEGDMEARGKLIEHNLRLVAHICKKYYAAGQADQDDLVSIGTIGLIKAVSTFNHQKGIRFATYAAKCIENEILMQFRSQKKNAGLLYINDSIEQDGEGGSLTYLDVVADDTDIVETIDLGIRSEKMIHLINTVLTPRERIIIKLRFGLNNQRPQTQKEVAGLLGISRSYVSRIEKKALGKLYKGLKDMGQAPGR